MFIAYIYDLTNTVVAQVEQVFDLDIQKKLNDVGTASFGIYHTNPVCKREFLKEYTRIKINEQIGNTEKTMFDGVLRGIEADLDKTYLKLESFEHLFDRRLLHVDYNFVSESVDAILSGILSTINSYYNTNITLDCGITTLTSKSFKQGESFLKVLKDIAGNGYEFIVENMVLKFKETIGIDRTTGENFVEYKYDISEPDDRSIDSVKMIIDGKELANGIIGKSGSSYSYESDATSISNFGLIESSFTSSGDDTATTQSFLADHKDSFSEFDIGTITNNFFEADLGDLVKVYIFVGNDLIYFNGSMKIIQKQFTGGDLPKIKFTLSKTKVKSKNILDQINDIQQRLKTVEFK